MELKDFIKETLLQISEGVISAQEELKNSGCLINPLISSIVNGTTLINEGKQNERRQVQNIKMSIAISITENKGEKSGIGIVASVIKAGLSKDESEQNHTINRIDFEIPISLPVSKFKK